MRFFGALAVLATSGCGSNAASSAYDPAEIKGKTVYCGESFSVAVSADEKFAIEPGTPEDFILYQWDRPSGRIVIYEGNHPEAGGIVFKTGRFDWPNVVSVHGSKEDAAMIRIFKHRPAMCREPARLELQP